MDKINEVSSKPIDGLRELIDNRGAAEFMGAFPRVISETYLNPILKQEELGWDDLDTLQDFSENILNYSLQNTIILLSCVARGGSDAMHNETQEPLPSFGIERDHAIHDLAKQGTAICSMFNALVFHLVLHLKRKLEAEGGAQ